MSKDPNRVAINRNTPMYVKGTSIVFAFPLSGDSSLTRFSPSMRIVTNTPPKGKVEMNILFLRYSRVDHDRQAFEVELNQDLSRIQKFINDLNNEVSAYNSSLPHVVGQYVAQRRGKHLKDQGLVASFGIPIRRRDGAPETYAVPIIKKQLTAIRKPDITTQPFVPEPILENQHYEDILRIISNMVLVMERSPKAFSKMKEEDMRFHFLVQLNGQYEGQATGETFNFEGKTDIIIRVEGKNIFIAECKFWRGAKGFLETIDQLIGYTSWRDTKAAIILFNQGGKLSEILQKIPLIIIEHPNLKRQISYGSETAFRFIFHQKTDPHREVIVTVLVFEVPR
ncbi:hypothetical protein L0156_05790 [bacterium]|nr:hypothetical protein [bacterium]